MTCLRPIQGSDIDDVARLTQRRFLLHALMRTVGCGYPRWPEPACRINRRDAPAKARRDHRAHGRADGPRADGQEVPAGQRRGRPPGYADTGRRVAPSRKACSGGKDQPCPQKRSAIQSPVSISVAVTPPRSGASPMAVHTWLAPQDTPCSMSWVVLGFGLDSMLHAVPSQTSTSVW
jgi:hypothetical protein